MFCSAVILRSLNCMTGTVLLTEGRMLAGPNVDNCYVHDLA